MKTLFERLFGGANGVAVNPKSNPKSEFDGLEAEQFVNRYQHQFMSVTNPANQASVANAFKAQDFEDAGGYVAPTTDADVSSPSDFNDGKVTR